MDNKNEKTFADLFSSSSLDDDDSVVDLEKNEESLSSGEEKSITFDNLINNVDDKLNSNDISDSGIIAADLSDVREVVDDLFVDDATKKVEEKVDNPFMEVVKDENKNVDVFENTSVVSDEETFAINDGTELNNDIKINEKSNVEEINPFLNDNVSLENKEVVSGEFDSSKDNDLNADKLFEGNDIFGNMADDKTVDMQSDNPFLNGENSNGVSNSGESINQLASEAANKKNTDEENKSVSVSPFFDNESSMGGNNAIVGNVFNNISVDETNNISSKLDKIELNGTKNFNVKLVKKKISLVQFVTGVISYAFFIFLVLVLVTLLAYVLDIKIRAAKGDYSAPKFNAYVVLTGSMLPEIKVKDVVVTKKVDANELEVGDIITFASSDSRFLGTIITHRIIKKNQDKSGKITFQTKGDYNNVADSALVQSNNIYGKVILKIPKLGYLQDFLATQGGWIIVILLPCVTVISYDIVKLSKGLKRRKKKINVIK